MPNKDKDYFKDQNLKASTLDGMFHAVMLGFGETYLTACAVFLNASPFEITMLIALPPFLGALGHWLGVHYIERGMSRRNVLVKAGVLHSILWLPIAVMPEFGPNKTGIIIFSIFLTAYHFIGSFMAPAWNSLIGDLVPEKNRGDFFGYRAKLCGMASFLALCIAGWLLFLFQDKSHTSSSALGFSMIFLIAGLARGISTYWLSKHSDPEYKISKSSFFSFIDFLKRTHRSNFAKFVFYVSIINGAAAFSAPFFAVYMLVELKMSYLRYMVVIATAVLAQYITLRRWGALSDKYGYKKILNLCAVGAAINPVLWLFFNSIEAIIFIQIFSGVVWAGFNLSASNFMFDAVTPQKRARAAASQSTVSGTMVFIGTSIAAIFVTYYLPRLPAFDHLPITPSKYFYLFAISGLIRAIASLAFLPFVKEVKDVEKIGHRELLFRVTHIKPLLGLSYGIIFGKKR